MLAVLRQAMWRRRAGLVWWSLGLVGLAGLLAVAYPTVRGNGELDRTFAGLPPGVQAALGLDPGNALTSPVGYLNSQYFANLLPIVFLVYGIGVAAWCIGGDEAAGTLELLLANPLGRVRVALERAGALVALVAVLSAVPALALAVLAPPVGLTRGLSPARIVEATAGTALLALTFSALAFAVGAATGRRSLAISIASALAVLGFMIEGLAAQVKTLRPVREASPWHWLLGSDPLRNGLTWHAWFLPLAVSLVLVLAGTAAFSRRDLR
jgi:ABC-2 type transport system permease protein